MASVHHTTLYYTVLKCTKMYYNVLQCTTMYYNVLQCTTMYYNVLQCITMYYDVLQCITMYYNVLRCTFVYLWISTICRWDTRGWVMPKHLDFKKWEKDEMTFTFSCNCNDGKFWGTQPPTKESMLSLRHLLLRKIFTSQKRRKLSWSLPMFVIKWCNLHRNSYIILRILLHYRIDRGIRTS